MQRLTRSSFSRMSSMSVETTRAVSEYMTASALRLSRPLVHRLYIQSGPHGRRISSNSAISQSRWSARSAAFVDYLEDRALPLISQRGQVLPSVGSIRGGRTARGGDEVSFAGCTRLQEASKTSPARVNR